MPGSYIIKPIEVKMNKEAHLSKDMSPFCCFTLGDKQFASETANFKGDVPTWTSSVTIETDLDTPRELCLNLVDKKCPDVKDALGKCSIDLGEIEHKGQFRNWYSLRRNNKPIGEILLDSCFKEELSIKNKETWKSGEYYDDKKKMSQNEGFGNLRNIEGRDKNLMGEGGLGKDRNLMGEGGLGKDRNLMGQGGSGKDRNLMGEGGLGKDRNVIGEGGFGSQGMMSGNTGQQFKMSDKDREFKNYGTQGVNENLDKGKNFDYQTTNPSQFRTGEVGNKDLRDYGDLNKMKGDEDLPGYSESQFNKNLSGKDKEMKGESGWMESGYSGKEFDQKVKGQHPVYKMDAEKYDI